MAENIGFEPMIEVSLLMTTLYVATVGLEPTTFSLSGNCANLLRHAAIIKSYSITISPNSVQVKAFGKFVLVCALDSKSPARKRGIIFRNEPALLMPPICYLLATRMNNFVEPPGYDPGLLPYQGRSLTN